MNKLVFVLILGLIFFGIVSGVADDKISVIVLEKNFSQMRIKSLGQVLEVEIPEDQIDYKYSNIDGFSAKVTRKELKLLQNDPSKIILVDKIYHTNLDVSVPQIGASDSWDLTVNEINISGAGQTVCIIDSGVDYNHPIFGGCYGANNVSSTCQIIGGYNFVNDNEDPMDDYGHGTHVAGIIASSDNIYKGVSPNVKIISIKALDDTGSGFGADIVAGIDWCVNNASRFNISVISMSLGDNSTHNSYCNDFVSSGGFYPSIANAVANNITVVVSAGNCDQPGQLNCTIGVSSPACVEDVIIAGTVNDADEIFFMRGALLELLAPGIDIMSSMIYGATCEGNKNLEKEFLDYVHNRDNKREFLTRRIGEFAMGTNIFVDSILGNMLQDEKKGDAFHIAAGDPLADHGTGAGYGCKGHLDCLVMKPTVRADGLVIMEAGQYTEQVMRATLQHLPAGYSLAPDMRYEVTLSIKTRA